MKTSLGTCELCARRPAIQIVQDEFPSDDAESYDDGRFRICLPCLPGWKRTQKRLRLERAAPDLLAACREAGAFLDDVDGEKTNWNDVRENIRRAIAKAEGKTA